MISKKQFTKQIDYGNLTIEDLHNALEPYKVSVLNGNSISGIIKLSEVKGDVMIIGQPLKEIQFPEGVLLVGVLRYGEMIIPHGESILQPDDSVFFLGLKEAVEEVESLWFHNHN